MGTTKDSPSSERNGANEEGEQSDTPDTPDTHIRFGAAARQREDAARMRLFHLASLRGDRTLAEALADRTGRNRR